MRISDWSSDVCSSDLTARFERVYSRDGARAALDDFALPVVIKADGLAAGKGVTIAETREEDEAAIDALIAAGRAGGEAVIEEFIDGEEARSEEHTSELQSLMRISYAVFCLKKKKLTAQPTSDTEVIQSIA